MAVIEKAKETMTAKTRVLKTFAFEKTDRVPIGYEANPGIHARLAAALGLPAGDREALNRALGVDCRGVGAPYTGPCIFKQIEGRRVNPVEGSYTRRIENAAGYYEDYCDFPLQGADDDTIAAFPVPDPDDFDLDAVGAQIEKHADFAVFIGGAGVPDIINSNGRIMGMEDVLVHLLTGNEAALRFIDRRIDMHLKVMERTLERYGKKIDFMWLGEDLGTQRAPMISPDLFRRVFRPRHQKFVDLAKAYGLPVMVHTCGSSSWAYEDFIEMGVSGVDTLQPEAADMSPRYLKEHFGGRLNFRGCISTGFPLAFGTAEQTCEHVLKTLETMMECRGYHFAPAHCIQDNSPVENVIEMYRAAHRYGVYR